MTAAPPPPTPTPLVCDKAHERACTAMEPSSNSTTSLSAAASSTCSWLGWLPTAATLSMHTCVPAPLWSRHQTAPQAYLLPPQARARGWWGLTGAAPAPAPRLCAAPLPAWAVAKDEQITFKKCVYVHSFQRAAPVPAPHLCEAPLPAWAVTKNQKNHFKKNTCTHKLLKALHLRYSTPPVRGTSAYVRGNETGIFMTTLVQQLWLGEWQVRNLCGRKEGSYKSIVEGRLI